MSDLAIRVDGLSKSFRLRPRNNLQRISQFVKSVGERITQRSGHSAENGESLDTSPSDADTFWALKDVTFEVKRGEVIGFVGRNGAGKSTLLKLLSRITSPTRGRIEIHGRVRSLLEVGTGFHHDLTGRENIYLNGAILGMSRAEISRKFDEIVAFAEVDRFLDTPVKYYSTGMAVRLAFAVAANLEPEILIVDEVLAVGDAAFQQKCIGKMGESNRQGKTLLIVSHSLPVVTTLCQRAVLLERGRITAMGTATEVVRKYMTEVRSAAGEVVWSSPDAAPGDELVRLRGVVIFQEGIEGSTADIDISKDVGVRITYWKLLSGSATYVAVALRDANGTFVLESSNTKSGDSQDNCGDIASHPTGLYEATCKIPANFLNEGRYVISIIIGKVPDNLIILEDSILTFDVHDTGTMHEEYVGNWAGPIIRPRLPWNTVQISSG